MDHTRAAGGAEIALRRIASRAKTWNPIIAVPKGAAGIENDAFNEGISGGAKIEEIGPRQMFGASNASIVGLARFGAGVVGQAFALRFSASFRDAAVVHANTSRSGLYGALACVGTRKPLVVHLRDMVDEPSLGRIGLLLFRRLVLPRANAIIGNSRSTMESAVKWSGKGAVVTVIPSPAGIDARMSQSLINDRVESIAMVARIDPWKGQRLLIEAFADVFKGTKVRLRLAGAPAFGHGEFYEELKCLVTKLGIEGNVDFLGHVSNVKEVIAAADICVQASIRPEPLGQNVLQYLAAGKPTIVANEGGPTEWVYHDKNGLHFIARDRESLASVMRQLSSDTRLRRRLARGTQQFQLVPTDSEVTQRHGVLFHAIGKYNRLTGNSENVIPDLTFDERYGIPRWTIT
ncbi:Glycosyl transferase 4-like domain-containing protein [Arthrobacter alpinus]|uniref:Glycosyl transferase 4-like domain-containing protein n=1 Tax=Arthrobacter alpinus TaxID=656366 RepID=A0A1H5KHD3_9MICC|nr:Glycosyl transferase 4-like domain-containing protein [Arthrobacter alpinus]